MGAEVRRRAVFLDRDGTLIEERNYLADPDGVLLLPGVAEALCSLRRAGFVLVVVTNQSGIARGLYGEADFRAVTRRLEEVLREAGVVLDATLHCPHHPDYTGPCACRKPGTALYREAAERLGIALEESFYVGDRLKDVLPARELGGVGVLVRTGYGAEEEDRLPEDFHVHDDLLAVARWIVGDPASGTR